MKKSTFKIATPLLFVVVAITFLSAKAMNITNTEIVSSEPKLEIIPASSAYVLPEIFAVTAYGPQDCVVKGTFVDFTDAAGGSTYYSESFTWTSNIPGFNGAGSHYLKKTVYIPPTTTPGCYTVTAFNNGECTSVTFRVLNSASDTCIPCEAPLISPCME